MQYSPSTILLSIFSLMLLLGLTSCNGDLEDITYDPTAYIVSGTENLGIIPIPEDNQMTREGVELGQHLFYDKLLSSTETMSCASCHDPQKAFTDGKKVSAGVTNEVGSRSSMSLINSAYYTKGLFWDGREQTLESQAILPVEDPIELFENWDNVEEKLKNHPEYPAMFRKAFGIEDSEEISRDLAAKALAQFERAIISGNSKFDRWKNGVAAISEEELLGNDTFFDINPLLTDGECSHCHNKPLFTSNEYFDNGLQTADTYEEYVDKGLGGITGEDRHIGLMRAPTLRNIALTAPYMHDGRFETLEEVVEHYDSGGHVTPNRNELIYNLQLTEGQKEGLVLFMKMLTDTSYLDNPLLINPFE